ncbi:MAG: C1 family peptidase [Byssovorax sp.]
MAALAVPAGTTSPSMFAGVPVPPPSVAISPPGSGCGHVMAGGMSIPLDCATPGYGEIPTAARHFFPQQAFRRSALHGGAAELPAVVDHREDGTEGPVRHQGRFGFCTAFSLAAAVDHALAARVGHPGYVSAMHLWAQYHEPQMAVAAKRVLNKPLASEETWPYSKESNQKFACSLVPKAYCQPMCDVGGGTCVCEIDQNQCGYPLEDSALEPFDKFAVARVTTFTRIEDDKASLMTGLAKGQDLWIAMAVTPEALGDNGLVKNHDGLPFVVANFRRQDAHSSHAMTIAGYRVLSKGTYFLLHNSWGEGWAERGYAWIHETTLRENLQAAYIVDAEPWNPSGNQVPPRTETPSACSAGLIADSITGQCTPPCPDGSARYNGACADPRDCPPGYVNLYGECVVAAPDVRGSDPTSGISYACAAGGCSYAIPFGTYGCFTPWCSVSCPSPRFRLAGSPYGLVCSE